MDVQYQKPDAFSDLANWDSFSKFLETQDQSVQDAFANSIAVPVDVAEFEFILNQHGQDKGIHYIAEFDYSFGGSGLFGSTTVNSFLNSASSTPPELQKCFVSEEDKEIAEAEYHKRITKSSYLSTPHETPEKAFNELKDFTVDYFDKAIEHFDHLLDSSSGVSELNYRLFTAYVRGAAKSDAQAYQNVYDVLKDHGSMSGMANTDLKMAADITFEYRNALLGMMRDDVLKTGAGELDSYSDQLRTSFRRYLNREMNTSGISSKFSNPTLIAETDKTEVFFENLILNRDYPMERLARIEKSQAFTNVRDLFSAVQDNIASVKEWINGADLSDSLKGRLYDQAYGLAYDESDRIFDLIEMFPTANAKKIIYEQKLGINEKLVDEAFAGNSKPIDVDDKTWALAKKIAASKRSYNRWETGEMVGRFALTIGLTVAAAYTGGASAGFAAALIGGGTEMATSTYLAHLDLKEAEAMYHADIELKGLGSKDYVELMEKKKIYTILNSAFSTGLSAGGSGIIFEGTLGRKIFYEAVRGSIEGVVTESANGNTMDVGLNQRELALRGEDPNSYTPITGLVMAGTIGGVMGGGMTGVSEVGGNLLSGVAKLFIDFKGKKPKPVLYMADGQPTSVEIVNVLEDGRVILALEDGSKYAFYGEDVPQVVRQIEDSKSASTTPKRTIHSSDDVVSLNPKQTAKKSIDRMYTENPDLRSTLVPEFVLAEAVELGNANPDKEIQIQRFSFEDNGVTRYKYKVSVGDETSVSSTVTGQNKYDPELEGATGHEFIAHFHKGDKDLDARFADSGGVEFDDDIALMLARVRENAYHNQKNANNPNHTEMPTTMRHEVYGVDADVKLAVVQFTIGYDHTTNVVSIDVQGSNNVSDKTLAILRKRIIDVDHEVAALHADLLPNVAGQKAASRHDQLSRRATRLSNPVENMPVNLMESLDGLEVGESLVIGRTAGSYGLDLSSSNVSGQHFKITKTAEGFVLNDTSSNLTIVKRKSEFVDYHLYSERSQHVARRDSIVEIKNGEEATMLYTDGILLQDGDVIQIGPDADPDVAFVFQVPGQNGKVKVGEKVVYNGEVYSFVASKEEGVATIISTDKNNGFWRIDHVPISKLKPVNPVEIPSRVDNDLLNDFYKPNQRVFLYNRSGQAVEGDWKINEINSSTGEVWVSNGEVQIQTDLNTLHQHQSFALSNDFSAGQNVLVRGDDLEPLDGNWKILRLNENLGIAIATNGDKNLTVSVSQLHNWQTEPLRFSRVGKGKMLSMIENPSHDRPNDVLMLGTAWHSVNGLNPFTPSLGESMGAIEFKNGVFRVRTTGDYQITIIRGDQEIHLGMGTRLGRTSAPLKEGDLIQLGDLETPILFEKPFASLSDMTARQDIHLHSWKPVQTETDVKALFQDASRLVETGKTMFVEIPVLESTDPKDKTRIESWCAQLLNKYRNIIGFQLVNVRSDSLPAPHKTVIHSREAFHHRINIPEAQDHMPVADFLGPPPGVVERRDRQPMNTGQVRIREAAQTRFHSFDRIAAPTNGVRDFFGYQVGQEVFVLRDKGRRGYSNKIPEGGWRIVSFNKEKGTVVVSKPDADNQPNPLTSLVDGVFNMFGLAPVVKRPTLEKEVPVSDVMTREEIYDGAAEALHPSFAYIKRREELLNGEGVMPKNIFQSYFGGNFRQTNVGNCYLISLFKSLKNDSENFEALMRLSIKKVANGWEVRIPLGDPNGEAIPISIEDLKPKLNPNYGNKYLHKDKIDRRRYLNPVEGPVGFQILEAAYIKLMSAKNGMTYGPLDRSVIDNGGKSTKAVKKLLGDGIDIEVIGKNEYDSTLGTQGEGVSHDVLEYLINFVPSKDMTTVSSKTTRDKSDHDKSFVEGGIQFAYNHAYSLLSVDVVRPKEQGGQVSVRGVRLVNPWDNSQTIYVPIDIFMASFRCLEVGEVNVGQMYQ